MQNAEMKPKVVATLSPEEIAAFKAWREKESVQQQAARVMVSAVMDAIKAGQQEIVRENIELWAAVEKAHGLDGKGHFHIDYTTGEVTEPPLQQNPLMAILGSMCDAEHGDDEVVADKPTVN